MSAPRPVSVTVPPAPFAPPDGCPRVGLLQCSFQGFEGVHAGAEGWEASGAVVPVMSRVMRGYEQSDGGLWSFEDALRAEGVRVESVPEVTKHCEGWYWITGGVFVMDGSVGREPEKKAQFGMRAEPGQEPHATLHVWIPDMRGESGWSTLGVKFGAADLERLAADAERMAEVLRAAGQLP